MHLQASLLPQKPVTINRIVCGQISGWDLAIMTAGCLGLWSTCTDLMYLEPLWPEALTLAAVHAVFLGTSNARPTLRTVHWCPGHPKLTAQRHHGSSRGVQAWS